MLLLDNDALGEVGAEVDKILEASHAHERLLRRQREDVGALLSDNEL